MKDLRELVKIKFIGSLIWRNKMKKIIFILLLNLIMLPLSIYANDNLKDKSSIHEVTAKQSKIISKDTKKEEKEKLKKKDTIQKQIFIDSLSIENKKIQKIKEKVKNQINVWNSFNEKEKLQRIEVLVSELTTKKEKEINNQNIILIDSLMKSAEDLKNKPNDDHTIFKFFQNYNYYENFKQTPFRDTTKSKQETKIEKDGQKTTVIIRPHNSSWWTGSVYKDILSAYVDEDKVVKAGDNWVGTKWRSYARFDINDIPDNADITSIEVKAWTREASSSTNHRLEVKKLTVDPLSNGGSTLYNDIGNGTAISSLWNAMCYPNQYNTITLYSSARQDLEDHLSSGNSWWAVGFQEYQDNDVWGQFDGYDWQEPYCTVTYEINEPDLEITNVTISPSPPLQVNEEFTATVYFQNNGDGDAGQFYLDLFMDESYAPTIPCDGDFYTSLSGLAAGASSSFTFSHPDMKYSSTGTKHQYYVIDSYNNVPESNENNNVYGPVPVVVLPEQNPDLTVTDIWTVPPTPTENQSCTLYAKVKNVGNANSSSTIHKWYWPANTLLTSTSVQGLNPNQEVTVSHPYTFISCGTDTYKGYVEPVSGEINTNNNYREEQLTVNCEQQYPDLIVQSFNIPSSTQSPSTIYASGSVKNQGNASSNPCNLGFYLSINSQWDPNDTNLNANIPIGQLNAGGTQSFSNHPIDIPSGLNVNQTYYVIAYVDDGEIIDEGDNENNNTNSQAITIIISSDIIVGNLKITGDNISGSAPNYTILDNIQICHKDLTGYLLNIPNGTVSVNTSNETITVTSGCSSFNIPVSGWSWDFISATSWSFNCQDATAMFQANLYIGPGIELFSSQFELNFKDQYGNQTIDASAHFIGGVLANLLNINVNINLNNIEFGLSVQAGVEFDLSPVTIGILPNSLGMSFNVLEKWIEFDADIGNLLTLKLVDIDSAGFSFAPLGSVSIGLRWDVDDLRLDFTQDTRISIPLTPVLREQISDDDYYEMVEKSIIVEKDGEKSIWIGITIFDGSYIDLSSYSFEFTISLSIGVGWCGFGLEVSFLEASLGLDYNNSLLYGSIQTGIEIGNLFIGDSASFEFCWGNYITGVAPYYYFHGNYTPIFGVLPTITADLRIYFGDPLYIEGWALACFNFFGWQVCSDMHYFILTNEGLFVDGQLIWGGKVEYNASVAAKIGNTSDEGCVLGTFYDPVTIPNTNVAINPNANFDIVWQSDDDDYGDLNLYSIVDGNNLTWKLYQETGKATTGELADFDGIAISLASEANLKIVSDSNPDRYIYITKSGGITLSNFNDGLSYMSPDTTLSSELDYWKVIHIYPADSLEEFTVFIDSCEVDTLLFTLIQENLSTKDNTTKFALYYNDYISQGTTYSMNISNTYMNHEITGNGTTYNPVSLNNIPTSPGPLVISQLNGIWDDNYFNVSWESSESTYGNLYYGESIDDVTLNPDNLYQTQHEIILSSTVTGISPGWFYKVSSVTQDSNIVYSEWRVVQPILGDNFDITGNISYYSYGDPVQDATVNLTSSKNTTTTDVNGDYNFYDIPGGTYDITPYYDDLNINGINLIDYGKVKRHILGLEIIIPGSCQWMAADVNGDGSINAIDYGLIKQRILGYITEFPIGNWLFEPSDISINLQSNITGQDFVGIKVGDVNGDWTPSYTLYGINSNNYNNTQNNSTKSITFTINDAQCNVGDDVDVEVTTENFTGAAVELHIVFDDSKLTYNSFTSSYLAGSDVNVVGNQVNIFKDFGGAQNITDTFITLNFHADSSGTAELNFQNCIVLDEFYNPIPDVIYNYGVVVVAGVPTDIIFTIVDTLCNINEDVDVEVTTEDFTGAAVELHIVFDDSKLTYNSFTSSYLAVPDVNVVGNQVNIFKDFGGAQNITDTFITLNFHANNPGIAELNFQNCIVLDEFYNPIPDVTYNDGSVNIIPDQDISVLVVDHDLSEEGYTDCWPYYETALIANGIDYTYYQVASDLVTPDLSTMQMYDCIIWFSGECWGYFGDDCMTPTSEGKVANYLDGDGSLFFSGQDYLWASYPSAGTLVSGQFPHDYLGLSSVIQDTWYIEDPDVIYASGVTGSAASGYSFTASDIFTTSREGLYIDRVLTYTADAMGLFNVTSPAPQGLCAVQVDNGTFKSIFTTLAFAAIDNPSTQVNLLGDIIDWLTDGVSVNENPIFLDSFINTPNPFSSSTNFTFALKKASHVVVDVYNIRGQLIKNLSNEYIMVNNHSITWDGTDNNGVNVPSGVYFTRIITDDVENIHKVMLIR